VVLLASGCAARHFTPPDPASAMGEASAAARAQWATVAERCQAQQALTAEGALSGRVGGSRVRGRVQLGLARAGGVRLEGVAPFGAPVFILAGTDRSATLVLPRESRTYDGAPADILEALAGIRLTAAELLAVVNGCLGAEAAPSRVSAYRDGLVGIETGGVEVWMRTAGSTPHVAALRRGDLLVEYPDQLSGFPLGVRFLRTPADGARVDLGLRLTQVERNAPLADAAFQVESPAGSQPMTLDELRRAGLLGAR
jgi:hypothetical protein